MSTPAAILTATIAVLGGLCIYVALAAALGRLLRRNRIAHEQVYGPRAMYGPIDHTHHRESA